MVRAELDEKGADEPTLFIRDAAGVELLEVDGEPTAGGGGRMRGALSSQLANSSRLCDAVLQSLTAFQQSVHRRIHSPTARRATDGDSALGERLSP